MTGIAILGAGIFAREQHLPAIEATPSLTLKAIYSRSESTASALASNASSPASIDIYHDTPSDPSKSLDALLARSDISAVVVCLPILTQPQYIRKAVEAGKHVISEKPVAKDVATAQDLVAWYGALPSPKPVWAVGENFRFWPSITYATEQIKSIGGDVVSFNLEMWTLVQDDNRYYNTAWRKTPEYQGGFLLDGGIHFVAALRAMLAGAGDDIAQLTARSALLRPNLPPVDTLHGVLTTRAGASGLLGVSFGTEFKSGLQCQVTTTQGRVTMTPNEVITVRRGADGAKAEEKKAFEQDSGVKGEIEAFAKSVEAGVVDARQSADEALRDLLVLQGLLESGAEGGAAKTV